MVALEFRHPTRDESGHVAGYETLARLTVDGQDARIEGDESVVDFEQRALNLRSGETISFSDNGEEWTRGIAAAYRTPYLWAEIVEDSDPLPDVAIEAVEIADPAERAVTQHSAAALG
jgi:hypothetical protein